MAERVEIIVTAKDTASQVLRGVAGSFGSIGNAVQMLTSGGGLEALTSAIVEFGKESVDATVAYANEVRNLSKVSGQSAEETSRLIQLADDYKISTNDLTLAVRKLAADGLTLNVETLAKLSDEYKSLNPGQERAAFLMDKFGRSGVRFAEIMEEGGDSLRSLNAEIDDNLLLTDEAVKSAREYEKALDAWDEQTQKLQYSTGNLLLPVMTRLVDMANTAVPIFEKQIEEVGILSFGFDDLAKSVWEFAGERNRQGMEEQAAALNSYGQAYGAFVTQLNQVPAAASAADDALADQEQTLSDLYASVVNLSKVTGETEAERQAAINQTTQDMIIQRLMIDGELTEAEMNLALESAKAFGIVDTAAITTQKNISDLVNQFVEGKIKVGELYQGINNLPAYKEIIINIIRRGADDDILGGRANGGPVSAGQVYRANEFGTEYFQPNSGGHVIPMSSGAGGSAGGQTVVNITYAPSVSLGNRAEFETVFVPLVRDALRKGSL